jgi:transmembrane sensor
MSDQPSSDARGDNANDGNLSDGDYERILRFVSGECAVGEDVSIRAWIERDPQRRALSAELTALRHGAPSDRGWHTEQWVGRLEEAMKVEPGVAHRRTPRRALRLVAPSPRLLRWRVAAWVAATAAVAAIAVVFTRREPHTIAPVAGAVSESRTYSTVAQQRNEVRLPDGTRVHMAPGSTVRFVAGSNPTRRDVYLQGEAYFVVAHDSTRPFTVYAGNASAHDIGTSFSVRSYPEDRATQVVVREGEVALSGAGLLKAGDVGRLGNTGKATVRHNANVAALLSWVSGVYTWDYHDTELHQIVGDLHRWKGVEIAISDSTVLRRPFTGSLERMSSAEAVGTVAASLGLRVTVEGNRFRLNRF